MKVVDNKTVHLEKDEVIPVFCRCGHIYQPPVYSEWSLCHQCGRENVHGVLPLVDMVERDDNEPGK